METNSPTVKEASPPDVNVTSAPTDSTWHDVAAVTREERTKAGWQKIGFMILTFLASIACAIGQHFFYKSLEGKPPPDSAWTVWHGATRQQVNIAIGNTLAFLTKAFLFASVANAHDQIVWRTVKNSTREIGLLDHLFASRNDWLSSMNMKMWWKMPFATSLLWICWTLQLTPLITPSALNIRSVWSNSTFSMRTPHVDFTSMNFASVESTYQQLFLRQPQPHYQQTTTLTYRKPQAPVQRSVQAALLSGRILAMSPPAINSSWHYDFHGPALSCKLLDDTNDNGLRRRVFSQYAAAANGFVWQSYLSWMRGSGPNGSLPFMSIQSGNYTTYEPKMTLAGGSPLGFYILVNPRDRAPDPHQNITIEAVVNYMMANSSLWEVDLQNVTYSTDFSFMNGVQVVNTSTSEPLNSVDYLSVYQRTASTQQWSNGTTLTQLNLNQSFVENLAYQSVMESFASAFVGNITITKSQVTGTNITQLSLDTRTSMALTPLIQAREMANISQAIDSQNVDLGNIIWDGKSIEVTDTTTTRSVSELVTEMFRNATLSLMSEPVLNPDYSSTYAPNNDEVQIMLRESVYAFSPRLLWIPYGLGIGFVFLAMVAGGIVIRTSEQAYTTQFSTIMRVSQNVSMPSQVLPQDTGGEDPRPKYLKKMPASFPSIPSKQ